jgi:hypothetical protein
MPVRVPIQAPILERVPVLELVRELGQEPEPEPEPSSPSDRRHHHHHRHRRPQPAEGRYLQKSAGRKDGQQQRRTPFR